MAVSHLPRLEDHPEHAEKWQLCTRAKPLSIEPCNTVAGGNADCEDMPRKSVDIRLTDYPDCQKRGVPAPFSCLPAGTGSGSALNSRRAYRNKYLQLSRFN